LQQGISEYATTVEDSRTVAESRRHLMIRLLAGTALEHMAVIGQINLLLSTRTAEE